MKDLRSGFFLFRLFFYIAVIWLGEGLVPCSFAAETQLRIRNIKIDNMDVFGDRAEHAWFHHWFQVLHVTTRTSIITRELLFKKGDFYDPDLIEETGRNLRQLSTFADAYIRVTKAEGEDKVDIDVVTIDRFTLRVSLGASSKGEITKWRASLGESNFLGLQKSIHFTQEDRSDGNKVQRYVYIDPRLFKHFQLEAVHSLTDEGVFNSLDFGKPFRTLNDKQAFSLSLNRDGTKADYYQDGAIDVEIPQDVRHATFIWTRELGTRVKSRRLSLEAGSNSYEYGSAPDWIVVPDPYKETPLLLSLSLLNRQGFEVFRNVDSLIYREDIELDTRLSLGGGVQFYDNGQETQTHEIVRLQFGFSKMPTKDQLVSGEVISNLRFFQGENLSSNWQAFLHYYLFSGSQTLVAGIAHQYSYANDELNIPLTLGGDRGLRGFKSFSITGNKNLLINIEHRYIYPIRAKHWALAQVVFFDAGNAWKPGESMSSQDLRLCAGFGLRIGAPSLFGKKVARIDVAFPINDTETGYSISATVGQVFNYNSINNGFSKDF